jgi:UDP-N-acetylglucosamine 2-epimerase (non-hydrolysing)
MHNVVTIFGTRPEAIKLCPLCIALKKRSTLKNTVLLSGQHTAVTDRVLESFSVTPDYRLPPPSLRAPLALRTAALFSSIAEILPTLHPSGVIVHGDTATAYAAASAAFLHRIPVFHVEAGLRSGSLCSPFPEEYNRRAISLISALDFAPTEAARQNLLREGKSAERIYVTGNTVIDALRYTVTRHFDRPILRFTEGKRIVLFTVHRRENLGEPMRRIFSAVKRLARMNPDLAIICPVHHSPAVRQIA